MPGLTGGGLVKYEEILEALAPLRGKVILRIACLSIVSLLAGSSILGLFRAGPLGMIGLPLILLERFYLYLPVGFIAYIIAWTKWTKTSMSRLRYCLGVSIGIATVYTLISFPYRNTDLPGTYLSLRILGSFLGISIPVFGSLWIMTKYGDKKDRLV